jgi:diaminopimelate decarboxylase
MEGSVKDRLYPSDRCEVTPAGHLVYDGVDLAKMAQDFPTPFYLLSENILRANYERFMASFAGVAGFKTYFSVKTNYESGILRTLRALGSGAEISGALDMEAARRAGFRPQDVVFDGPCKSEEELRAAIDWGVHLINIESDAELKTIDRLARQRGRIVKIGVRIDPIIKNPVYGSLISTYKSKFGFPVNACDHIFDLARRCKHVEVVGLHAHIGSQILSPDLYVKNLDVLAGLAARLKKAGFDIREINIGGGFPAQSVRNLRVSRRVRGARILERLKLLEKETPGLTDFGTTISRGWKDICAKWAIAPMLTAEPGRSLVSNAGAVVGKVRVVKGTWVFSDLSINDVPENLFFSEFRVFYPNKFNEPRNRTMNLSGPTLATNDVIIYGKDAPGLQQGDVIAIFDTGAYSISRSNQFTRARSGVYFVTAHGAVETIRRPETVDDVMRMQVWPTGEGNGNGRRAGEPAAVREQRA